MLQSINLVGANITRTCWQNVKNFHLARFDNTYLEQPQVRQLVVTGQGQDQNFDHLNLNGAIALPLVSQTRAVPSLLTVRICRLSGLNIAFNTVCYTKLG
jgi:uncharacterized protein YjbI with pentapeptide repeats